MTAYTNIKVLDDIITDYKNKMEQLDELMVINFLFEEVTITPPEEYNFTYLKNGDINKMEQLEYYLTEEDYNEEGGIFKWNGPHSGSIFGILNYIDTNINIYKNFETKYQHLFHGVFEQCGVVYSYLITKENYSTLMKLLE